MREEMIDFSKYSSIKIGSKLPVKIVQNFDDMQDELRIIGYGNNILVSPEASNIAILGDEYDYIVDKVDMIEVGGATSSQKIYRYFKDCDLSGLEFLKSLPGSLGGLIKMNAGMKEYEIKDILDSVCINGKWKQASDLEMNYRFSNIEGIIFAARFKKLAGFRQDLIGLFEKMRSNHPKKPSCGSCFKNPKGDFAGRLLESVGLRGYSVGQVGFSQDHANFLINLGGGSFEDAAFLIDLGKIKVFEEHGIVLEEEVIVME